MRRAAIRSVRLCAVAWLLLLAGARAQTVPVLTLPGAGALTAVIETRERDGFDQRLRYAGGDGRNHAEIALRRRRRTCCSPSRRGWPSPASSGSRVRSPSGSPGRR